MKRVSIGEAKANLADTVNRVAYKGERVVLNRRGKDVAALVPVEDLKVLEAIEDRIDLEDAKAALAEGEKEGWIPWEQIKAEFGL